MGHCHLDGDLDFGFRVVLRVVWGGILRVISTVIMTVILTVILATLLTTATMKEQRQLQERIFDM